MAYMYAGSDIMHIELIMNTVIWHVFAGVYHLAPPDK